MIKIAVCDDNIMFVDKIYNLIVKYSSNNNLKINIFTFADSEELINSCKYRLYNIVFLDVEMKPFDGIKTGENLRLLFPDVILVYVSSYINYAVQGYKVKAFRYILKNNIEDVFDEEFSNILSEYKDENDYFVYKKNGENIKVSYKEILYLISDGRKVTIKTINNKEHSFYSTLDSLEKEFEEKNFLRVQQSYIVNIKYAVKLSDYKIYLNNKMVINTSRRNFKELKIKYVNIKGRL